MFDAVTIGSATRDVFLETNFQIIKRSNFPSGRGYLLPLGEKLKVDKVFFTIGGNAVNASVTFSRQNLKTACAAGIGNDVGGEEIKRHLKKEGVKVDFLKINNKLPTAYSVILLQNGERTILNYSGANNGFILTQKELNQLISQWWYISLSGDSIKIFPKLVQTAIRKKISLALNPAFQHLKMNRGDILTALPQISFLVLNEEEAACLAGISFRQPIEVFKKLDRWMPNILAITRGQKGAIISDGQFIYEIGIFSEKKLIDRTGAGDAFGSGFVAGLIQNQISNVKNQKPKPAIIEYALRLAAANATSVVEKLGATEGIITINDFHQSRWQNLKIKITSL